jgi:hypothetical protein
MSDAGIIMKSSGQLELDAGARPPMVNHPEEEARSVKDFQITEKNAIGIEAGRQMLKLREL